MSDLMKYQPQSYEDLVSLAKVAARSSICAVETPEDALVILMTGAELGLTAMQSLRGIYIVKKRPVLAADTMAAVVRKSGVCATLHLVESTEERCTYKTRRKDDDREESVTWTMEDAKRAQLAGGDTWKKYPQAMLRARTLATICRAVYPDVLLGMYDPEELETVTRMEDGEVVTLDKASKREALDVTPDASPPPESARRVPQAAMSDDPMPEPSQLAEDSEPAPNSPDDLGGYDAPQDWSEDRKWQTQKGRFFALMNEAAVLGKDEIEAFRTWIKRSMNVASFRHIAPDKLQRMNDRIQQQKPLDRGEWVRAKLSEGAPNLVSAPVEKPTPHTAA